MKILAPFTFFALLALSWVMADDAVTVEICTVAKCAALEGSGHKLIGTKAVIARDMVLAIVRIDSCEQCSQIRTQSSHQINVVGSVTDIRCKFYGGDECGGK